MWLTKKETAEKAESVCAVPINTISRAEKENRGA